MLFKSKYVYMNAATGEADGGGAAAPAGAATAPVASATLPAADTAKPAVQTTPADPAATPATFEKVGDPGIDLALDFIARAGIKPDDPAYLAALDGDFDLLRATLATKGDKAAGYDAVIALAEKSYKAISESNAAASQAVLTAVHEVAGGEEQWAVLRDWAKANADDSEKAALNGMMNAGPLQAKAAALYLKSVYEQAPGTSNPPANAVTPDAGAQPASGGPLDAAGYKAAVQELSRKLGHRIDGSPEYATLQARRRAYRG